MKTYFCLLLFLSLSASIFAQNIKVGDAVEINKNMSGNSHTPWVKGTVNQFDKLGKLYTVKLLNGNEIGIVSETPEIFISVAQSPLEAPAKPTTPVAPVPPKDEKVSPHSTNCDPTEENIKQMIKDDIDW